MNEEKSLAKRIEPYVLVPVCAIGYFIYALSDVMDRLENEIWPSWIEKLLKKRKNEKSLADVTAEFTEEIDERGR